MLNSKDISTPVLFYSQTSNQSRKITYQKYKNSNLSIKARNLCLSVCACVWATNISADQNQTDLRLSTWLLRGSRVCNVAFVWTAMILLIIYFRNALQILLALLTIANTVMCALEPITAEPTTTPHLKKQVDLHLQRRELDRDFASGSVPFCSVHLN